MLGHNRPDPPTRRELALRDRVQLLERTVADLRNTLRAVTEALEALTRKGVL